MFLQHYICIYFLHTHIYHPFICIHIITTDTFANTFTNTFREGVRKGVRSKGARKGVRKGVRKASGSKGGLARADLRITK